VLGTLIGALAIGIIDTFGRIYLPGFAMFTVYLVFILMLLVKPTGLMGRKGI
jgi:branched-chain amino acid transport system permease protein